MAPIDADISFRAMVMMILLMTFLLYLRHAVRHWIS